MVKMFGVMSRTLSAAGVSAGLVMGSMGVASAAASPTSPGDAFHRFVKDGITITWGNSPNMNDLQIRETPNAKPTTSSGAEAKIGKAILDAYWDTQKRRLNGPSRAAAATDYCSFSPDHWKDANFKPACRTHDWCYSSSSYADRAWCDLNFKRQLKDACRDAYRSGSSYRSTCFGVAEVYYDFVRNFGEGAYEGKGDPS